MLTHRMLAHGSLQRPRRRTQVPQFTGMDCQRSCRWACSRWCRDCLVPHMPWDVMHAHANPCALACNTRRKPLLQRHAGLNRRAAMKGRRVATAAVMKMTEEEQGAGPGRGSVLHTAWMQQGCRGGWSGGRRRGLRRARQRGMLERLSEGKSGEAALCQCPSQPRWASCVQGMLLPSSSFMLLCPEACSLSS